MSGPPRKFETKALHALLLAGMSQAEAARALGVRHPAVSLRLKAEPLPGGYHTPERLAAEQVARMRAVNESPGHRAKMRALQADPQFSAACLAGKAQAIGVPLDRMDDYRLYRRKGFKAAEARAALGIA